MSSREFCILSIVLLFCAHCESPDRRLLLKATWSVDSIYTFYNGFDFVQRNISDEPDLNFQENGRGMFVRKDEQRPFVYELPHADTLWLATPAGIRISTYFILKLDTKKLVLRQEKGIPFKGEGQQRYEIRYLSKGGR
jgi:hypothetical protein